MFLIGLLNCYSVPYSEGGVEISKSLTLYGEQLQKMITDVTGGRLTGTETSGVTELLPA